MKSLKLLLTAACATVLLTTLVSIASARNFSTSDQHFRAVFREVHFRLPIRDTVCPVTIEGTFHSRTFVKMRGLLMGYITRAELGICSIGLATILTETLPWHVQYLSFTGTLPESITSIRLNAIDVSFRVNELSAFCLAKSTATEPAILSLNRELAGAISSAEVSGTIMTTCPNESGTLSSDRGPVTVLNSTTRIFVRLI